MKNIVMFGILLFSLSKAALGAGSLDGIYSCTWTVGGTVISTYYALNGHTNGTTVWTIPATSPSNQIYGYGIGEVVGNTYSGTSLTTGQPFSFIVDANQKITGTGTFVMNGVRIVAAMSCSKIW